MARKKPAFPQITTDFLDAIRDKYEIESDYLLAEKLQCTRGAISNYRNKTSFLDDGTAIWVANLLNLDPIYVLSCVHAERAGRANRTEEKEAWEGFLKKFIPSLVAPVLALGLMSQSNNVKAANDYSQPDNTNYTKRRRRYAHA